MMQVDVKARPVITAEIKTQIDDSPIVKPANTDGIENLQLLNDAELNSAETIKSNTALAKEFGNIMPDVLKNFRQMNDLISKANQNLPAVQNKNLPAVQNKNLPAVVEKGLLAPINTGTSVIQSLGNGDVAGAAIKTVQGTAGSLKDVGQMADSAGIEGLGKAVAAVALPLMVMGGVGLGVNALADQYKKEMPNIFGAGKIFGATDDFTSMKVYQKLNEFNTGTGMDISEFNSAAKILRQSGVGNITDVERVTDKSGNRVDALKSRSDAAGRSAETVANVAQTTSRWAYATGGSADQYAQLAGLMSRYGGSKDVSRDFNYLVSSGKAMGLNDSQIPEFLSGVQKVMEDGIAKGFTRSSTDVANTLVMFSKMSGGSQFWSGEQGAKKLNQINSGISGATSLSKMEDVLVYSAFNDVYGKEGGSYLDVMEKMEQGLDAQTYDTLMNKLNARFDDDEEAKVEAVRKMTGLNYSASRELVHLRDNGVEVDDAKVKKVFEAPENYNKETRWQESLNKLSASLAKVAEGSFNLKIGGIEFLSDNVEKIKDYLIKETDPAEIKEVEEKKVISKAVSMGATKDDTEVMKAQKEHYVMAVDKPEGLKSGANKLQNQQQFVTDWLNTKGVFEQFRELYPQVEPKDLDLLIQTATNERSKKAKGFMENAARMGANDETGNGAYITKEENSRMLTLLAGLLKEFQDLKNKGVNVNLTESK